MLKIAIAQINPTIGDFQYNTNKIIQDCKLANEVGADIIVFPELCIPGYYPMDLIDDVEFIMKTQKALMYIRTQSISLKLTIVLGTITKNKSGIGKPYFNSAIVLKEGDIIAEYHKQLLPTYNIFNERRHFESGDCEPCIITISDIKIGILICEDIWNEDRKGYVVDPTYETRNAGAELIISLNASPSNLGKRKQRHDLLSKTCNRHKVSLLYVNCIGGQDELVFDGASFAMNKTGEVEYEAPMFESTLDFVSFDGNNFKELYPKTSDLGTYVEHNEFYYRQIILGLRDYLCRCGFEKVVVGCSGGIDSALVLALAVDAIGCENVTAITMPSKYSSLSSVEDSETLCLNLGIRLFYHGIRPEMEQAIQHYEYVFHESIKPLTEENMQARERGRILMTYSNNTGALLLTTGNKSEIAVGYCTLYGDTTGGLGIIGDLYKTEVFALAGYYNELHGSKIIPDTILNKEPSAELALDQKDADSLPPYEILDIILKSLLEKTILSTDEMETVENYVSEINVTNVSLIDKIKLMIARSEYKRNQMPPIIRVRPIAFGKGRQMPIAAHYN